MWLAYLRFDAGQEVRVALVRCENRDETEEVLRLAKGFGTALTEYATFYSGRTIKPMHVPNFAEELIFTHASFVAACGREGARPQSPPGSPRQSSAPALPAGHSLAVRNEGG